MNKRTVAACRYRALPLAADSVLFCANSSRFRPSFSDSILRIVPWYSDRVRSTESRMSLTVALKISFREDSRKIFRSLDLAMLDRVVAALDTSPDGLCIWLQVSGKKVGVCESAAAVCGTNKADSRTKVTARKSWFCFANRSLAPLLVWRGTVGLAEARANVTMVVLTQVKHGDKWCLNNKNCKTKAALLL